MEMTEERAREILKDEITECGALVYHDNLSYEPDVDPLYVFMSGHFRVEQLEAIAFWMRRAP